MNPHKIYIPAIVVLIVLAVLIGSAWSAHVKDEARRDAVIHEQEKTIADLHEAMDKRQAELKQQLSELEGRKQSVIKVPSSAPQIIREMIPTPIQQTAAIEKDTLPNAPVAVLTKQNEIDLAQFALSCKECDTRLQAVEADKADQTKQIAALTTERDAAMKAAKGGSVLQRFRRNAKWFVIGGLAGYGIAKGAH
jgi:peptidoglycan hydrolase CwlO-like protein